MDDERMRLLRHAATRYVLAARSEYLKAGASPLKHWDQVQERMVAAARSSATAQEWVSQLAKYLGIQGGGKAISSATDQLCDIVAKDHTAFLDLVEREDGYIMAMARVASEEMKEARKNGNA